MMRKLLTCLALAATPLAGAPALAHPEGHDREVAERAPTLPEIAKYSINRLVAQSKLPRSWVDAVAVRTFTRTRNGAEQVVVEFRNDAINDPAKRRLFVVMHPAGNFISANHRLN